MSELSNGRNPITIQRKTVGVSRVEAKSAFGRTKYVHVDGHPVGKLSRSWKADDLSVPVSVPCVEIELSNGKKFKLHSRPMKVVVADSHFGTGTYAGRIFDTYTEIELPRGKVQYTFEDTSGLNAGDILDWTEYPFQWIRGGTVLSNGQYAFPRERPHGAEWGPLPVKQIPAPYYTAFLAAIEGRFLTDLIDLETVVTHVKKPAEDDQPKEKTQRQKALERTLAPSTGALWRGTAECKQVMLGQVIVFEVPRENLPTVFVCDNPGVGAIYFFDTAEEARQLASGLTARSKLRPTQPHVDHVEGWEAEVTRLLETVERFTPAPTQQSGA